MRRKKYIEHKVVVAAFIVGILISMYIKTLDLNKVYITLEEKKDIEYQIEYTKKEIKKLQDTREELESTLNQYEHVVNDENLSISEFMEEKMNYFKMISGYSKVEGKGLVITIKDSEKELESGQNPNDLIVHDIDILRILNDLKKAGAEAISINGERVLPLSKIKCSGATITVNETTYGQPFIIRAIGEVETLKASIISPESYADLLRTLYGISIEIEVKNDIIINSYEKSM